MPGKPTKETLQIGPAPAAPYSTAVRAGGFIYVSGTLAQDAGGAVTGRGDIRAQTRTVIERMSRVLGEAGSSLADVVSASVYLTSAADFEPMNEVYRGFWPSDPPTRTTVITGLVLPEALIEMTMIAVPAGAERTVIRPDGWASSPNPYSYAIRTGDTLFLSGLVPRRGRDNVTVEGDVRAQTRAVMENAAELLEASGMSFANVVSARVYLTDTADFGGMNESYREFFPTAPPARATVKASLAASGYLVEMTFIASSSAREIVGAPLAHVPITPGIRAGARLYVSGMLGNTPATAGDVRAQTRETLARIRRTLEQGGAGPEDVVDATVYLTDATGFTAMNEEYRAFFGGGFPARATVVTPLIAPDGLVEIMVTAALG